MICFKQSAADAATQASINASLEAAGKALAQAAENIIEIGRQADPARPPESDGFLRGATTLPEGVDIG